MDTSFTHSFDWLHKLIYLYNISTLPSKQVTRTKMTNQILKWMTIALQQMKKHLFADTDVQTGKKNVTKKSQKLRYLFAQEINLLREEIYTVYKRVFFLSRFIKFSKIQINAGFQSENELYWILIPLRNLRLNEFPSLTKSCVFRVLALKSIYIILIFKFMLFILFLFSFPLWEDVH